MHSNKQTGTIDVWVFRHAQLTIPTLHMREVLSPAERERAEKIRHSDLRLSYLQAKFAFRTILASHLHVPLRDLQMTVSRFGKPLLPAHNVEVSQSHSHDWSAVAVSATGFVGIDIEHWRPLANCPQLACHIMTDQEAMTFEAIPSELTARKFLELWTRKEAVLKCAGLGLRQDPRGLHTGWDEPAVQFGDVRYYLSALPVCGHLVGHLASHAPQKIIMRSLPSQLDAWPKCRAASAPMSSGPMSGSS
ncbi:4'-phosphopantetheinyl transferase superfamily protein [Mesorhizobium sp. M2A.F.Ca.ET.043.05.1.1]|uniref:4'-phosphopantetheinyl transferase family protein n=1 Tax=Mesorhizobium sp. M2A.F.Ca.ET.043.05.1.1 TaxID=2493671 RepID=UPI000F75D601|nr:4'-phosphopantetheinyl transferase superfamily protein [Mesorhizobium sp. M2A.F.Ca.ET.043.05.1.1]AZO18854.1 4'-phosphopantetheinyl transferase superfamily protein [Mesorhizobium sp. M2A.F.Ca.ET.043.05.1.1]